VPVIFITGHADANTAGHAVRSESVQVLVKPFDEQALFDAIRQAVETAGIRTLRSGSHDRTSTE
jgi:FixJ family two-component response regulator